MKEFLKNKKIKSIIIDSLLIVVGLLFCIVPNTSVNIIESIISALMIVLGVLLLLGYCLAPTELKHGSELLEGIILIVVGFLLSFFSSLFILGVGIILCLSGVRDIAAAIILYKQKQAYLPTLIIGIVFAALGAVIIILCFTSLAKSIIIIIVGCLLILEGVSRLIFALRFYKAIDNISEKINDASKGSSNDDDNNSDFTDYSVK